MKIGGPHQHGEAFLSWIIRVAARVYHRHDRERNRSRGLRPVGIIAEATVRLTVETDAPREALAVWKKWRAERDHLNVADDAVVLLADTPPNVLDGDMKVVPVEED